MWRDRVRHNQRVSGSRRLLALAKLSFLGVIGVFLVSLVLFPVIALTLPSPDKVIRREGFSTKILDRNGKVLYDIFENQKRTPVKLEDVPEYLKQATISIEDKNFYIHQGFDPTGMFRAVINIFLKGKLQGGSTLTQQLVKNSLLSSERTIIRKIKEFVLASEIERKFTKDEILNFYFNETPYGGNTVGAAAASETYFGKKLDELTLVESAILAGLPQRPSYYSPYSSNPKAYIGRTQEVLRRMREDGYITREQEEEAKGQLDDVSFQAKGASFKAPHFVQYVQELLEKRYDPEVVEGGGLRVTTSLDLELQESAQEIVASEIAKVEKQRITNGGVVVLDPDTGEILAMVGSKNFNDPNYDGQVNVTTALRQPGSAFKPFTYVTALKEGYTPSTLLMDVETTFPGGVGQPDYKPVNYDAKFRGPVQIRFALGNSINIPAVKLLALVGIKDVLETSHDLGITTLPPTQDTLNRVGLSLTLGGGEVKLLDLSAAYTAFVNGGFRADPIAILKVEDKDGKVLEEVKSKNLLSEVHGRRVLSQEQAYLIYDILSDNNARKDIFGVNSLLNISGRKVAVKTGTTNDKRDNWTIGGNPNRLVGVWVGNNNNEPMLNVASGVSGASPIWRKVLLESLKGISEKNIEVPQGIVNAEVDSVSGYLAHDGYPARSEIFAKGSVPGTDKVHVKLKVCKTDGKLASPSDISSGNFDEKEFFVFKEEDPTSGGGPNKWQEGILNWQNSQSDPRYHPPSDYCGSGSPVSVSINEPGDRAQVSNSFDIKLGAQSTSNIVQVELEIDGTKVRGFSGPPYTHTVNLTDGVHTIRAKAKDSNGSEAERVITIGVNVPWDYIVPTPTPTI